jgi:hypothetical protein
MRITPNTQTLVELDANFNGASDVTSGQWVLMVKMSDILAK